MRNKMWAWNLYAPADLRYEEVPVPEIGPGEVLVKVRAVGVCGSDISRLMKTGTYHYPTICGHEFAGEVVAAAPDVANCRVGDRVTVIPLLPCGTCDYCRLGHYQLCEHYNYLGSRTDGAYAEYVKVWAGNVLPLPKGVPFEAAAMTDPAAVALHAIRRLPLQPGQSVVVLGIGPIGLLALEWAKLLGAGKVVAVDIFPEKLAVAKDLGADYAINGREEDPVKKSRNSLAGRTMPLSSPAIKSRRTRRSACSPNAVMPSSAASRTQICRFPRGRGTPPALRTHPARFLELLLRQPQRKRLAGGSGVYGHRTA